jgi:ABC-type glycerol-3-phosphate transport system substrate-binding protein
LSKRLIAMLAAVLAVVIVAAGCGSSGDDSSSGDTGSSDTTETTDTTAALSKAEFIKQGDAICTKGNKTIETEANEFAEENDVNTAKPTRAQKEEVIVAVVAPSVRKQGEEIAELGAPSGDEAEVEAIVAAVEEGADELEKDPGLLIDNKNPLAKSSKLAASYGLKVCGEE